MIGQQTIGKRIEILIQVFVVLTKEINVILVFVKKVLPIVTTIINMVATILIQWRVIIHELKIKIYRLNRYSTSSRSGTSINPNPPFFPRTQNSNPIYSF